MSYFKDFKLNLLVQKVLIFVGTAFLTAFSKEWLPTHDLKVAIEAGLAVLPQAIVVALGFDQLTFNFFKQPEVKAMVSAMQTMQASQVKKED
jgi:hypothetical protein